MPFEATSRPSARKITEIRCMRVARITATFILVATLSSCSAPIPAVGAISGGIATRILLQDMDDRATHVVQNAAASGSLVSSKAARDVELLIDATRQTLNDELDTQWDKLDKEKIGLLRELNSDVDRISDISGSFGKLEDTAFLDTDTLASRLPFAQKMPRIRKVEGSSQFYKSDGNYEIRVTSNVFQPFGDETEVFIGDTKVPASEKEMYTAVLTIPNNLLPFQNFQTFEVPLTIKTKIAQKSFFSKGGKKDYSFTIPIELFAKYPGYYQMDQSVDVDSPDLTKLDIKKGSFLTVPGCGDSGCNAYYNVCTNFPLGTTFTRTLNQYDSFAGWGGFGAVTVNPGVACQTYWQHSHNTARNVSIDVEYHPLKTDTAKTPVILKPLVAGKSTDPFCTASSDPKSPGYAKGAMPTAVGDSSTVCWIQFGRSYLAEFDSRMKGYTLVVHMFNGQNPAVVDGVPDKKDHPGIEVQDLPGGNHRAMFRIIEPTW